MKTEVKIITNNVCGVKTYQIAVMEKLPSGGEHAIDWIGGTFKTRKEAEEYLKTVR